MKEAFIEMQESSWKGSTEDYLKYYAQYYNLERAVGTDIVCPNCLKSKLVMHTIENVKCNNCNQRYYLIDVNTVKYKE